MSDKEGSAKILHVNSKELKCTKKHCNKIPCQNKGQEQCIDECNCYSGYSFCNKKGYLEFRTAPSIL